MTDPTHDDEQLHPDGMDVQRGSWSLPVELSERYAPMGVFVETGTYEGGGVQQALDAGFKQVYSIEVARGRFARCRDRYKDDERVALYCGATELWLPEVLLALDGPACIFLDAHTAQLRQTWPLLTELGFLRLAGRRDHVILIDDVDILYGKRDWAQQANPHDVHTALRRINPAYNLRITDNKQGRECSILIAEPPAS